MPHHQIRPSGYSGAIADGCHNHTAEMKEKGPWLTFTNEELETA
jgi:hypothetical protein